MSVLSKESRVLLNKLIKVPNNCPHCGNTHVHICVDSAEYSLGLVDATDVNFQVICSTTSRGCGATSGWFSTREGAIDAWNTTALIKIMSKERDRQSK